MGNQRSTSRRTFLSTAALLAGAAAATSSIWAGVLRRNRQPNIILMMADDLGYADLSCYGRPDYQTPNIDLLAKQGTRFTQAYANSAVCSATRVGLITGRYQNRLPIGLQEPLGALDKKDLGLPPSHPTLPSLLKKVGYRTALLGKWHMGKLPNYGPLKSGYDHFWGFRGGALDYFSHDAFGEPDLWDDDTPVARAGYLTDLLGDRAVELVNHYAADAAPFFISLHFNAPHFPWEGPEDVAESRRLGKISKPGAIFDADGGTQKTYAAMVTRMDRQVGRVIGALKSQGIADDTIVIFTSDNGGERYSDTWPFSGKKTELLEGGLRIPAIIRWPGHIPPNVSNDQVMISMDWLPTLLAMAGARTDPDYPPDGIDLTTSLTRGAPSRPRTLCWRYLNLSQEACRDGDWKYLKILGNTFLFNLVDDPQERANLKERLPEIYRRLVADYQKWNQTMLALDPTAHTNGFSGDQLADHYGITRPDATELTH